MKQEIKGFISIGLVVAIVLTGITSAFLASFSMQGKINGLKEGIGLLQDENKEKEVKLGAANTSSTALTNTINEFRTNVNNSFEFLDRAITSSTSTNPGHQHSSTSISGFMGYTQGGNNTSSIPANAQFYMGTTSSIPALVSIPDCNNSTTSKLIFASGTRTFSCVTDQGTAPLIESTSTSVYSATTGITNVATTTISANTLVDNELVRATYNISVMDGTSDRYTFRPKFNKIVIVSSTITATDISTMFGRLVVELMAKSASNSQFATVYGFFQSDSLTGFSDGGTVTLNATGLQGIILATSTLSIDATADRVLNLEIEMGGGSGAGQIRVDGWTVEKIIN